MKTALGAGYCVSASRWEHLTVRSDSRGIGTFLVFAEALVWLIENY